MSSRLAEWLFRVDRREELGTRVTGTLYCGEITRTGGGGRAALGEDQRRDQNQGCGSAKSSDPGCRPEGTRSVKAERRVQRLERRKGTLTKDRIGEKIWGGGPEKKRECLKVVPEKEKRHQDRSQVITLRKTLSARKGKQTNHGLRQVLTGTCL